MAKRPVFIAKDCYPFYETEEVEFPFHSGFAVSQKQKSIKELHAAFHSVHCERVLEISTKSTKMLGTALSAFHLTLMVDGTERCIESLFQGSKCFEQGGPYNDLYEASPWEAKKDPRIRNSGELIGFELDHEHYGKEPADYFYNWIYMQALRRREDYLNEIRDYGAFTDIEFNPQKSINCQAKAVTIAVGLLMANHFDRCMSSRRKFLETVYLHEEQSEYEQLTLAAIV